MEGLPELGSLIAGRIIAGEHGRDGVDGRGSYPAGSERAHALSSARESPSPSPSDCVCVGSTSIAVVGTAAEGSSDASPTGDVSLVGGAGLSTSPVFYGTGGDPRTRSAHLVPSPDTRAAAAAGEGTESSDEDPRHINLLMPSGFIRGSNARNWLEAWDQIGRISTPRTVESPPPSSGGCCRSVANKSRNCTSGT